MCPFTRSTLPNGDVEGPSCSDWEDKGETAESRPLERVVVGKPGLYTDFGGPPVVSSQSLMSMA